jgi:miniconductance mechanosensitive channel
MEEFLPALLVVGITVGLAAGSYLLARYLLNRFLIAVTRQKRPTWIPPIERSRLVMWLALLAPLLILDVGLLAVLPDGQFVENIVDTLLTVLFVLNLALLFNATIDVAISLYEQQEMAKRVPLRGLAQLVKVTTFIVLGLIGIGVFFQVPTATLIASLAAVTAAAGFVFKDPILGFIAGIQLAGNNMVAIGDWVQMPKYNADGAVREITMTTVKVQNWDNTVTMIPSYSMVSDSFVNWRNVFESGGRRIKRAIQIDVHTVAEPTPAMLEAIATMDTAAGNAGEDGKRSRSKAKTLAPQGSNLGLFCAYLTEYLRRHPDILQEQTLLIQQLEHGEDGLPIEVIAYCRKTDFPSFTVVQNEIFEHAYLMLPHFGLRAYQRQRSGNYVAPTEEI